MCINSKPERRYEGERDKEESPEVLMRKLDLEGTGRYLVIKLCERRTKGEIQRGIVEIYFGRLK